MKTKLSLCLIVVLFIFCSSTAWSGVLDEVKRDFEPVSGYVIMPVDGEFLVDLDAKQRVAVGDVFSVVKPGEKIVHPVTKKVIGHLEEVKGLLEVTRVKNGYSYARLVGDGAGIKEGDPIRRYENVPSALWDYTGQGEAFAAELKAALPNLQWQDYAAAQVAKPASLGEGTASEQGLVFLLTHQGLQVRGSGFQVLHAYPLPESLGAVAPPAPVVSAPAPATTRQPMPAHAVTAPATVPPATPPAPATGPVKWEQLVPATGQGVQYDAAYPGYRNLGTLAGLARMTDFIKHEGRLLMAATDGKTIDVYEVGPALKAVAKSESVLQEKVVALHWWQPEASGPLYLTATLETDLNMPYSPVDNQTIGSDLFLFDGQRVARLSQFLPYLMGGFDLDEDGRPETLLGQRFDRDIFFSMNLEHFRLVGGELKKSRSSLNVPSQFRVQGSLISDLTGDGQAETVYVKNGILHIFSGGKALYESSKLMGGSLAQATYPLNPDAEDQIYQTVPFEVAPIAADIDGDGRKELIAVASERSNIRAPGIGPGVEKSWLAVFKYRDGMFVKGSIGDELEAPLQGLAIDQGQLLFVHSKLGSFITRGGRSDLFALPLTR